MITRTELSQLSRGTWWTLTCEQRKPAANARRPRVVFARVEDCIRKIGKGGAFTTAELAAWSKVRTRTVRQVLAIWLRDERIRVKKLLRSKRGGSETKVWEVL